MNIKVINFVPNNNMQRAILLGWCLVDIDDKVQIWMQILKGKESAYAKMPSNKIKENFEPLIVFANDKLEREISNYIIPIVMDKYINVQIAE